MRVHTPEAIAVYNIARKMIEMHEELPEDVEGGVEKWYVTGKSVVDILFDMARDAKRRGEPLDGLLGMISPYSLESLETMAGHATIVFMEAEERGEIIASDPDKVIGLFDAWARKNGWLGGKN